MFPNQAVPQFGGQQHGDLQQPGQYGVPQQPGQYGALNQQPGQYAPQVAPDQNQMGQYGVPQQPGQYGVPYQQPGQYAPQVAPDQNQIQALFFQVAGIDREIDPQEFMHFIAHVQPSLKTNPQISMIAEGLFRQIDVNNSGYISLTEFLVAFPRLRQQLGF